jgi:sulfur-carrier protein
MMNPTPIADSIVRVLPFGILREILGTALLEYRDIHNTDMLQDKLQSDYPKLKEASFVMALNRQIIQENTALTPGAEVALLPPFSGG